MEMQATDVMSGQMPLREPHSGWGRNISRQYSVLGVKSSLPFRANNGECHRLNTERSSVLYGWEDGGEWRLCADWRPECRCLSL